MDAFVNGRGLQLHSAPPQAGAKEPATAFPPVHRGQLITLQVNLGYRCNQACSHCHVNAGPSRTEMMDPATLALIPPVLAARQLACLDLTGGAPELHPQFRELVAAARRLGLAPAQVLHVGDDAALDVLGALGAGMQAVWVNRDGKSWAHEAQPHATVTHLGELCALLAGAAGFKAT